MNSFMEFKPNKNIKIIRKNLEISLRAEEIAKREYVVRNFSGPNQIPLEISINMILENECLGMRGRISQRNVQKNTEEYLKLERKIYKKLEKEERYYKFISGIMFFK